jgi:hypothetical protein|tara:strand:- start:180 stop:353 length:174 start_codon:yes stop_codon:yes gene_type:complete
MKDETFAGGLTAFIDYIQPKYSEDLRAIPMLALQGLLDTDDLTALIKVIEGDDGSIH